MASSGIHQNPLIHTTLHLWCHGSLFMAIPQPQDHSSFPTLHLVACSSRGKARHCGAVPPRYNHPFLAPLCQRPRTHQLPTVGVWGRDVPHSEPSGRVMGVWGEGDPVPLKVVPVHALSRHSILFLCKHVNFHRNERCDIDGVESYWR